MANVNVAGRYYARVSAFGWDAEKMKEKKYELKMRFVMGSKFTGRPAPNAWDESVAGLEIVGWFYPLKNDGGKNQGFRTMMMESFGWDGAKLSGIQPLEQWCQIDVEERADQSGKKSLRVQWIHEANWGGDVQEQVPQDALDALDAMYSGATEAQGGKPGPVASAPVSGRPGGR